MEQFVEKFVEKVILQINQISDYLPRYCFKTLKLQFF